MPTRVPRIAPSEITPPDVYFSRRTLLAGALAAGVGTLVGRAEAAEGPPADAARLSYAANPRYSVSEAPNKYEEITTYNNFYEFGTYKEDPSRNARSFRAQPWSVRVDGEAEVRGNFTLEDILKRSE